MPRRPSDVPDSTLKLLIARGIGPVRLKRLRERFESDDTIVRLPAATLATTPGVGRRAADAIRASIDAADPATERRAMQAAGARMVLPYDTDYPALLATIHDPPSALWIRGEYVPEDHVALAIVGSRACSSYGREQAGRLAGLLAECGLTIVSGGAAGIDSEAHRGALRVGGRTMAVMGCGLARCYPPQHADLFERIVRQEGALLSDYTMRTEPRPGHFPHRNRIISGLSLAVLLVEAARRSGALITARRATEEQGREVMAVPGPVSSEQSEGCHRLIQDGARLVHRVDDIVEELSPVYTPAIGSGPPPDEPGRYDPAGLSQDEVEILRLFDDPEPIHGDLLAERAPFGIARFQTALLGLELRGFVEQLPGRYYLLRPHEPR